MDSEGFLALKKYLEDRMLVLYGSSDGLNINNTICGHISHRQPGLIHFSQKHDLIIFVAGKNSSNGRVLFEVCRQVNKRSFFVSMPDEIQAEWFENVGSTGVCGATSTPRWLLEEVAEKIKNLI
jgi:4-hydroxy-3-methylbut-2-enyl diphosphate reductase